MTVRLRAHSSLILAALAMLNRAGTAQSSGAPGDPVVSDPVSLDTVYPPRTEELAFQSQGVRLNGFLYLAQGKGPHSTVILLHGFPGNERNLDLAQALRRSGMNVLFFDYRGSWGSGGTFSFSNALQDVASAVQYLRADSSVAAFRIDPHRLILVGHSMGGWLALMHAAADSTIGCSVALDFWNVGADGARMNQDARADSAATADIQSLTGPGAPIRASGPALAGEIKLEGDQWNPERWAGPLSARSLLVISTTKNESHRPLVAALYSAHAQHLTTFQWKTDHGFSDQRIRLSREVVTWVRGRCK
jgi:uncharacterized protein